MALFGKKQPRVPLMPMDLPGSYPLPPLPPMPIDSLDDALHRSEMIKATKEIIEDKFALKKMGKDFPLWSIGTKSLKLTFLNYNDAAVLHNLFEAEICKYMRSIPKCEHKVSRHLQLGQARMLFYVNLRRALGTENNKKMNERIALLSQIKQHITSGGSSARAGFFSRMFGGRR